jgi:hypothetical protein
MSIRSLRTVYSTCNSSARSSFSGAIDGRPNAAYIWLNTGESAFNPTSAISRIGRNRWSAGIPPGEQLVACFRPFIEHLVSSVKSRRTIQGHVDNIWAQGGEFISELNYDPPLRKRPVDRVLREMIRYSGPALRHADKEQQESFDITCEMFREFLDKTAR